MAGVVRTLARTCRWTWILEVPDRERGQQNPGGFAHTTRGGSERAKLCAAEACAEKRGTPHLADGRARVGRTRHRHPTFGDAR